MPLSRLLTLPTELRALIFEFALTTEQTVTFTLDPFQRQYYVPAIQPPLTRVSKAVRSECLPIYYECNTFVLHTESPKVDDAKKWLQHNQAYLPLLRHITLWIRYVPLANVRASSQGAIGISMFRPRKHADWVVEENWKWITVVRKPTELKTDAEFIVEKLGKMTSRISRDSAGPDDYMSLMVELRLVYIRKKMP